MAQARTRFVTAVALLAIGLAAGLGIALLVWAIEPQTPLVARGLRFMGRITGLRPLPKTMPPLAAERTDLRRLVVGQRDAAARVGDGMRVAELNGTLGAEAFGRAHQVASAWLARRSPRLGLLPHTLDPRERRNYWNTKDCASDLYAHLVNEALLIADQHIPAVTQMLTAERALAADLPGTADLKTGRPLEETVDMRVFGAVEYAKDGLLSIVELTNASPWYERLIEVVDQIEAMSPTRSDFGNLPSTGTEKNGELLQVLARLSARTQDPRYLERGRRIADAYCHEVLPNNGWLPAEFWDFELHRPIVASCRLVDHANEIVSGLVEWTIAEEAALDGQPERYRPAVEKMLDRLLEVGVDDNGMWRRGVSPQGPAPLPESLANVPNDNWGYLSSAYVAYARSLAEHSPARRRYLEAARRSLRAVTELRAARWEEGRFDGYADTLESAIYLLAVFDDPVAASWVDDEINELFAYQQSAGLVGGYYLDGNFIRTSLLYGLYRAQGVLARPWQSHVAVGACSTAGGVDVVLNTTAAWRGRLVFDTPRHSEFMGLAFEYPRLNGWPEWFVVAPEASCEVIDVASGSVRRLSGHELRSGLPFDLDAPTRIRLRVRCSD